MNVLIPEIRFRAQKIRIDHNKTSNYWCPVFGLAILEFQFNTLRQRQNGRHFADDIFKWIFLNENIWIPIKISLKFVPKVLINNIPALVQKMAWCRPSDKPLSEPMMVCLLAHICVTRPQWVNNIRNKSALLISKVDLIPDAEDSIIRTIDNRISNFWHEKQNYFENRNCIFI